MKKTILSAVLFSGIILTSCQNTQKSDEKNAKEKTEEAVNSAEVSTEEQLASDANAINSVTESLQANIDQAMSKVAMPKFTKTEAKLFAESFHKDLSGLVNANSGKKANDYVEKLTTLHNEYKERVKKEKLDTNDKNLLDKYVSDLITAVENANN